jgi:hypothetical protein
MELYADKNALQQSLHQTVVLEGDNVTVQHGERLKRDLIESLLHNVISNPQAEVRQFAGWLIHAIAQYMGCLPTSIQSLYLARARGEYLTKTVPSIEANGMSFDLARSLFAAMKKTDCAACIFALPVIETTISEAQLLEFSSAILTADIKEGFNGPIFLELRGIRHDLKRFNDNPSRENQQLRQMLKSAVNYGFFNFVVDFTALNDQQRSNDQQRPNDVQKPSAAELQRRNYEQLASLTTDLRELQPAGIEFAIGAVLSAAATTPIHQPEARPVEPTNERNVKSNFLQNFMDGYLGSLKHENPNTIPICKLLVDAGIDLKFSHPTLEALRDISISRYHLAGIALDQLPHLSEKNLQELPRMQLLEVNASKLFYDKLFESTNFPTPLLDKMHEYLKDACRSEWHVSESAEEFLDRTRPRTFYPFRKELFDLLAATKERLRLELTQTAVQLFQWLGVAETTTLIRDKVRMVPYLMPRPD